MASILIFDGVCRLCTASLRFVDRHDRERRFRYVPFQSAAGRRVCEHFALDPDALDSFILLDEGRIFRKAAAWAQTLKRLPFPWSALGRALGWLPRVLGDVCYDFVGRRRYRWFGRFDDCAWPPAADDRIASIEEVEIALVAAREAQRSA